MYVVIRIEQTLIKPTTPPHSMTNEYFCCRLNSSTSSSEEEIEMAKATGSKMVVLKRDGR